MAGDAQGVSLGLNRGDVYWALRPEPVGNRPVVIITRDSVLSRRANVTVVSVTTRERGLPSEVKLGPAQGLPRPCVANADVIDTIPRAMLGDRITSLDTATMAALDSAIHFALGLRR